jgi:hypothetical protein
VLTARSSTPAARSSLGPRFLGGELRRVGTASIAGMQEPGVAVLSHRFATGSTSGEFETTPLRAFSLANSLPPVSVTYFLATRSERLEEIRPPRQLEGTEATSGAITQGGALAASSGDGCRRVGFAGS